MRESLTILAILLIIALTAALIGPSLVDWSAHRAVIEARLSQALGTPVKIAGPIDLKLLPNPTLTLGDLSVAGEGSEPVLTARRAQIELSVGGLLRGEIEVVNADLEQPNLKLVLAPSGGFALPARLLAQSKVRIDAVAVRRGTVTIEDPDGRRTIDIENLDLDGEAGSLAGPFKGAGKLVVGNQPVDFRFATGAIVAGGMRLKLAVKGDGMPAAELDGDVIQAAGAPAGIGYRGSAVFSGLFRKDAAAPVPWRLTGELSADANRAALNKLEFRAGPSDLAMDATGAATVLLGPVPKAQVALNIRQIDLDRLLAGQNGTIAPLDAAALVRTALLDAFAQAPIVPTVLDFTVGLVSIGGDALTDVNGRVALAPGEPIGGRLEINGPGHTRLTAEGTIETGAAAEFKGHASFATHDSPRFDGWLLQGRSDLAAAVGAFVPFKTIALEGDAEISSVGFVARDLTAHLDRSSLSGTLVFTQPVGQEHGRLYIEARSDALDLDALPDRGLPPMIAATDLDLAVHVAAQAIKIARVGDVPVGAGRIDIKLTKSGAETRLDGLTISDLGGASVEAAGSLDAHGAQFSAKIDAKKLDDFAALVHRLMPGAITDALMARAAALSPAKLEFHIGTEPAGRVDAAKLEGTVGLTRLSASVVHDPAERGVLTAALTLDGAETASLLRQFGIAAVPLEGSGTAHVAFTAKGQFDRGFDAGLDASLAGSNLSWRGRVAPSLAAEGHLRVSSANAGPLMLVLALGAPEAATSPALDVEGDLRIGADQIALDRIKAKFADVTIEGALALTPDPGLSASEDPVGPLRLPIGRRIEGRLAIDRLTVAALLAPILGPPQPPASGRGWSEAKFLATAALPVETRIALHVGELAFGDGLTARNASLQLRSRPGVLAVSEGVATLNDGTVRGSITLRRDGAIVSFTGRLGLDGIDYDKPFIQGKLSGSFDFAATGDSAAALIGGLAGQGRLTLTDARLPALDSDALSRVIGAADAESLPMESAAVSGALTRETASAAREVERLDLAATAAGGVLHLGPVSLPDPRTDISASAAIDLKTQTIDMSTDLELANSPPYWTGTPPRVSVNWTGPLSAPMRRVDASSFFNGLSARALAINLARLEDLDADIRERAFFNRRLKAIEEDEERARERAAAEEEAAERRSAEERRRAEERAADNQHPPSDVTPAQPPVPEAPRIDPVRRKFPAQGPLVLPGALPAPR